MTPLPGHDLVSNIGMAPMALALLALLVTDLPVQQVTLREELQKHGVDTRGVDDLDREITSYAVSNDESWFAIAYYWQVDPNLLPPELRVRTLDRKPNVWRSALLTAETVEGGSALRIARRGRFIYLDLHINPSAGSLVVLSEDLKVRQRLYGWSSLILEDGRVFYENSMVHFAPAHPRSVSLYDPHTGEDVRVYPLTPEPRAGAGLIDRSIGRIDLTGATQVHFNVREQDMVLGRDDRGVAAGAGRDVLVTCDISKRVPVCTVQPKEKGRQDEPGDSSNVLRRGERRLPRCVLRERAADHDLADPQPR